MTGFSSKLIVKELSTALRGRSISYEVFTLNFREDLLFKGINVNLPSSKSVLKVVNEFNKYLVFNAFPELLKMEEELVWKSLQEYLDWLFIRYFERYGVSKIHLMKHLIKFLFANSGNLISINKIFNEMRSSGLSISRNSVYKYISYLEDSYILFSVKLFTRNIREQPRNPQKYFVLDIGLRNILTINQDKCNLLDSIVFLHLRQRFEKVYYFVSEQELDFIVNNKGEKIIINLCYNIDSSEKTRREINSLLNCMKKLGKKIGFTIDQ